MYPRPATQLFTLLFALCLSLLARADLHDDMLARQARFQPTAQEKAAGGVVLSEQSRLTVDSDNIKIQYGKH
jgi:hypothetical protein